MRSKHHIHFLLVLVLLTACSNQASRDLFATEEPAPSPFVTTSTSTVDIGHSTPIYSPTSTTSIQVAQTYTSTPAAQILPTKTSAPIDSDNLPKLSEVVISPIDIKNDDYFAWNPLILANDTTNELRDSCLWECVKYRYSFEEGTLTIILLRAGDHQKAKNTVENLREEFFKSSADAYVYTVKDIPSMPPTSWVLIDAPSRTKDSRTGAASIAYGSVVILVTYSQVFCDYIPEYGRYCEGPVGDLAYFSVYFLNWQMQNLITAGYTK